MSVSLTRFPWWLWGGKDKDPVSNGSSSNPSNDHGLVGVKEYDSVKFPSRNLASTRKVTKKWHSREERRIEKEHGDAVLIQSDGVYLSGSESDGPDWSIGWVEPHGCGFRGDEEDDDGFAVLVPCYRSGSKELMEGSNNQLLSALKNLPNEFSSEGKNYMELLSSLQNFCS